MEKDPLLKTLTEDQLKTIITPLGMLYAFGIRGMHVYFSTPITGGMRKYKLLNTWGVKDKNEIPKDLYYSEVVVANCQDAADKIRILNNLYKYDKIIAPARFEFIYREYQTCPNFTEDMFNGMWKQIIDRYVYKLYFNNHWNYSIGAITEWCFMKRKLLKEGKVMEAGSFEGKVTQDEFYRHLDVTINNLNHWGFDSSEFERLVEIEKEIV